MKQYTWLVVAVASPLGAPIVGAEVHVGPARGGERRPLARTDASGRAAASGLMPGDYDVLVSSPDDSVTAAYRVVHLEPGRNAVSVHLAAGSERAAGGAA